MNEEKKTGGQEQNGVQKQNTGGQGQSGVQKQNTGGQGQSGVQKQNSVNKQVYLKVSQITEVQNKAVFLKDIASVSCQDPVLLSKCNSLKVKTIRGNREKRYVEDVLDIIDKISQLDSKAQISNLGEVDYIIDYRPPAPSTMAWQWIKTIFVCAVSFFGAAFAIMTFNNDADVPALFQELYRLVMGKESNGFTILEASYSVGLAAGILIFFNHFMKWKLTTDPTPLEVEMRTYEEDICKTLIQNHGRKEKEIDVT